MPAKSIIIWQALIWLTVGIGWIITSHIIFLYIIVCSALILGLTFFSHRDPERSIPKGRGIIVAPSDGRVIDIQKGAPMPGNGVTGWRITIFLSLLDVHVNRNPVSGEINHYSYHRGRFHSALSDASSEYNEHTLIGISCECGQVFIRQIAGLIARRIVCRLRVGDGVQKGDRFGMIKFGSRVELYLPSHIVLCIHRGMRDRGGESVIGRFDFKS